MSMKLWWICAALALLGAIVADLLIVVMSQDASGCTESHLGVLMFVGLPLTVLAAGLLVSACKPENWPPGFTGGSTTRAVALPLAGLVVVCLLATAVYAFAAKLGLPCND